MICKVERRVGSTSSSQSDRRRTRRFEDPPQIALSGPKGAPRYGRQSCGLQRRRRIGFIVDLKRTDVCGCNGHHTSKGQSVVWKLNRQSFRALRTFGKTKKWLRTSLPFGFYTLIAVTDTGTWEIDPLSASGHFPLYICYCWECMQLRLALFHCFRTSLGTAHPLFKCAQSAHPFGTTKWQRLTVLHSDLEFCWYCGVEN